MRVCMRVCEFCQLLTQFFYSLDLGIFSTNDINKVDRKNILYLPMMPMTCEQAACSFFFYTK